MTEHPTFSNAAVAAPNSLAAGAGLAVLAAGGNAVEAMVAMAASIAVVYPHMNGIGGDGFWLIREPSGKVRAIEACGPAGSLATIERYRAKGYDRLPSRGPEAMITVAGAIGGWQAALDYAKAVGGRMPLGDLLREAIAQARGGYPISASEARTNLNEREACLAAPGFKETFFGADGAPPKAGETRRLPRLAETLEQLAHAGLGDFYRGDVARELAADLEALDAPVTRDDLRRFEAAWREPLSLVLPGVTLFNFPPPTQGLASLLLLGMAERLKLGRPGSADWFHGLIEASKRALAIRDRVVTDPAYAQEDPAAWLTPAVLDREAARIDMGRAAALPIKLGEGDTIWMGAIDGEGRAVSYIQSVYWEYGSGCVLPRTGIMWQNRGQSFSLDPNARNPLKPGRKPFHTLNPALAAFGDGRVASYGSMGGDGQPQFQAQVLTRYRMGEGVGAAVDAPRFLFGRLWGKEEMGVKIEGRGDPEVIAMLNRRGHEIAEGGEPYSDLFGHAGLLVRHKDGRVEATHDPRADGGAMGL